MDQIAKNSRDISKHNDNACTLNTAETMGTHNQPIDRRIQRTRQLLHDALFLLIIEQGYEEITIANITERANLGRTTFYIHYQDKEDLLKTSVKTLMYELQQDVEPSAEEICLYPIRFIRIFQHVAQRQHLYRALLRETGSVNIGNLMRTYFAELFQRQTLELLKRENIPSLSTEMLAAHAAGSLFGLLSWWLAHEAPPSAEQMGIVYFQLMAKGSEDLLL